MKRHSVSEPRWERVSVAFFGTRHVLKECSSVLRKIGSLAKLEVQVIVEAVESSFHIFGCEKRAAT